MSAKARPLRADAARNREQVLETAYRSFAAEGLSASVDAIAKRAGVGIGTVYRHFPTKNALLAAAVEHRLFQLVTAGRALIDNSARGEALFALVRAMATEWGASDRDLARAIEEDELAAAHLAAAEAEFMALLDELITDGQKAGTVQPDITAREVKAMIVAFQAVDSHDPDISDRVIDKLLDGIRA